METCPNIGGREVRRRLVYGYVGLVMTLLIMAYVFLFQGSIYLRGVVFLTSLCAIVPLIEARDKTCVVNAYLGIKNLGTKYERERDKGFLNIQRKNSINIMIKGILFSALITTVMFII